MSDALASNERNRAEAGGGKTDLTHVRPSHYIARRKNSLRHNPRN